MEYQQLYDMAQKATMVKKADGPLSTIGGTLGTALWITGAAVTVATVGAGIGLGYTLGKLTEPGKEDKQNMQKQYMLARMKQDNQVQAVQAQREDAERRMRQQGKKPVRMFG